MITLQFGRLTKLLLSSINKRLNSGLITDSDITILFHISRQVASNSCILFVFVVFVSVFILIILKVLRIYRNSLQPTNIRYSGLFHLFLEPFSLISTTSPVFLKCYIYTILLVDFKEQYFFRFGYFLPALIYYMIQFIMQIEIMK